MYYMQLVKRFEKDPDHQLLITNKLKQTAELVLEYLIRRTNEKADGANAPRYKVIPAFYVDQSKAKREKKHN